jgi:hypothetical protein
MASNGRHTEQLRQALKKQASFREKVGRHRAANLAMNSAVEDAISSNLSEPTPRGRKKAMAARRIRGN